MICAAPARKNPWGSLMLESCDWVAATSAIVGMTGSGACMPAHPANSNRGIAATKRVAYIWGRLLRGDLGSGDGGRNDSTRLDVAGAAERAPNAGYERRAVPCLRDRPLCFRRAR